MMAIKKLGILQEVHTSPQARNISMIGRASNVVHTASNQASGSNGVLTLLSFSPPYQKQFRFPIVRCTE